MPNALKCAISYHLMYGLDVSIVRAARPSLRVSWSIRSRIYALVSRFSRSTICGAVSTHGPCILLLPNTKSLILLSYSLTGEATLAGVGRGRGSRSNNTRVGIRWSPEYLCELDHRLLICGWVTTRSLTATDAHAPAASAVGGGVINLVSLFRCVRG